MTDLPGHFRLAPSSSSRWLSCPGSAVVDLPDTSNPASDAGNVAHKEASEYIENGCGAMSQIVMADNVYQQILPLLGEEKASDIADAACTYVDVADSLAGGRRSEMKIRHNSIPDFGGTIDLLVLAGGLTILDFKSGTYKIPAKKSTQLKCYALLAMQEFSGFRNVQAIIVQPRVYKRVQSVTLGLDILEPFEDEVRVAGQSNELHFGSHCWFCPLRPTCPEYAKNA